MSFCCLAHIASSRVRMIQPATPDPTIIVAPPGKKQVVGYTYKVPQPVIEETTSGLSLLGKSMGPPGNASGLWDTATPQVSLTAKPTSLAGRKHSATSAAPGSARPSPGPSHLASAADFSPMHFDEPMSDAPIPPPNPAMHIQEEISPMTPRRDATLNTNRYTPARSSPISHNPLLQRDGPTNTHTLSPSRKHSPILQTCDGSVTWAAAEGLCLIPEGFAAAGYSTAQVVGGITYKVLLLHSCNLSSSAAIAGRQLFTEYTSIVHPDLQVTVHADRVNSGQQASTSQGSGKVSQARASPLAAINSHQQGVSLSALTCCMHHL